MFTHGATHRIMTVRRTLSVPLSDPSRHPILRTAAWRPASLSMTLLLLVTQPFTACTAVRQSVEAGFLIPYPSTAILPSDFGLTFDEIAVPADPDVVLRGWFIPNDEQSRGRTVVIFHGSMSDITYYFPYYVALHEAGFNVALVSQAGFGASDGRPDSARLVSDGERVIEFVRSLPSVDPDRIGVLGISLGSMVALGVAARDENIAAVAVEDTLLTGAAARSIAAHAVGIPVVREMLGAVMQLTIVPSSTWTRQHVRRLNCPVLYMHGVQDEVTPPAWSIRAWAMRPQASELWLMDDAGHAPSSLLAWDGEYQGVLTSFFARAFAGNFRTIQTEVLSTAAATTVEAPTVIDDMGDPGPAFGSPEAGGPMATEVRANTAIAFADHGLLQVDRRPDGGLMLRAWSEAPPATDALTGRGITQRLRLASGEPVAGPVAVEIVAGFGPRHRWDRFAWRRYLLPEGLPAEVEVEWPDRPAFVSARPIARWSTDYSGDGRPSFLPRRMRLNDLVRIDVLTQFAAVTAGSPEMTTVTPEEARHVARVIDAHTAALGTLDPRLEAELTPVFVAIGAALAIERDDDLMRAESVRWLQRAIESAPDNPATHYWIGVRRTSRGWPHQELIEEATELVRELEGERDAGVADGADFEGRAGGSPAG